MTRLIPVGVAAISIVGCAQGLKVTPTRAADVGAPHYVTFFMLDGNSSGNVVIDERIKSGIEMALADKGLVDTSPEDSEAVVIAHTATAERHSRPAFYEGWGGWQWQRERSAAMPAAEDYRVGTLVVDMFDARTKELIWHAFATDAVPKSPNQQLHATDRAITRIFERFPWPSSTAQGIVRAVGDSEPAATTVAAPRIIFSPTPALLIQIAGDPVYRDVKGTSLERIVNTRAAIVRDDSGTYYLRLGDKWMQAYDLAGPWSIAGMVPEGTDAAMEDAARERAVDVPGAGSPDPNGPLSQYDPSSETVFVVTTPTDLIVTDGEPRFVPVEHTSLLHVTNTTACVFREPTDKELYVFLARGWLRAWTTNGPWEAISAHELPADLLSVPLRETCASGALREQ